MAMPLMFLTHGFEIGAKGETREEMSVLKSSHQHSSVHPGQPSTALSSDFKGLALGGCYFALIFCGGI